MQYPLALAQLQAHLHSHPADALAHYHAGRLASRLGQLSLALQYYLAAHELNPLHSDCLWNIGVTFHDLQQPEQAIAAFTAAYRLSGNETIRYNRAMTLLQTGDYPAGWSEYESRLLIPEHRHRFGWHQPEHYWRGQPFPGQTLVIYAEQGLGDCLQFCRYMPCVKALGGKTVLCAPAALAPVLQSLAGVDDIIPGGSAGPTRPVRLRWAVPIMSLPGLFRTTLETIPCHTPYLQVPADYRQKWQVLLRPHRRPDLLRIGFVFASANDLQVKSCPLPYWAPLFSLTGLQWYSLQKGDSAASVTALAAQPGPIVDLTGHIGDFADTAALLEQLDLLITIDTSVAHLAGALGKPTWLLLPFSADWRWLLGRSDSPWYPTIRLFRQPFPGQWPQVIDAVKAFASRTLLSGR